MCRPEQLKAFARIGKVGPNQIPGQLLGVVERPHGVRLEFSGNIRVTIPRKEYERQKDTREWVIEFPSEALRVV